MENKKNLEKRYKGQRTFEPKVITNLKFCATSRQELVN
jgi:hypothetical protein